MEGGRKKTGVTICQATIGKGDGGVGAGSGGGKLFNEESTVEALRLFNRWRRGDDEIPQPDPKLVGQAIDDACDALTALKAERDEARLALEHMLEGREHEGAWVAGGAGVGLWLRKNDPKIYRTGREACGSDDAQSWKTRGCALRRNETASGGN